MDKDATDPCVHARGAGESNLRNMDVDVPRDAMVAFTGVSGSGKSSLAVHRPTLTGPSTRSGRPRAAARRMKAHRCAPAQRPARRRGTDAHTRGAQSQGRACATRGCAQQAAQSCASTYPATPPELRIDAAVPLRTRHGCAALIAHRV
ncbi:hypothetical protein B1R27_13165 [Streptomyces sp. GKU 895]|nr:hypothetical protein B1R27_13165 [Streptomyces sp. GKU 895]